jgi:dihydromonapterin reductase/dihydrofolate reductase
MTSAPVAVVTGASRRLGFEICKALMARGFRIYALHRSDTTELDQLRTGGARCLPVDLTSVEGIDKALVSIIREADRVNLLVNNASGFVPDAIDSMELARQASHLFQINSTAPMQLMAGLAESLSREGEQAGKPSLIVNITDIFAENPNPRFAAYCASKAALSNLTLSYARLLAPNVRVNAIMPGPIRFLPSHTEEQKAKVMAETLLPWEGGFASVVIQLLALLDNDFMTGALIPVDGGRRLA